MSRYSAATLGVPPKRVTVIYGGADPVRFHPGDGERRSGVLFVGRLTPHKGVDRLLRPLHRWVWSDPHRRGNKLLRFAETEADGGRDLSLAASMNYPDLPVRRRPKVALLATGDELVMPGSTPGPGQIIYSNGYALRALAVALSENSAPGGRLVGSKIVHPSAIDVGFAVEAEDGVLVPVIRNADQRSLKELVERYNELVELARLRRLPADATGGSVATVTNFGTFGLTWATPIPLPEQTLVLGMGAGRRVPDWDERTSRFVPVMEANLTLSFDHRVLDGGAAGRLLARVAALLNEPGKL